MRELKCHVHQSFYPLVLESFSMISNQVELSVCDNLVNSPFLAKMVIEYPGTVSRDQTDLQLFREDFNLLLLLRERRLFIGYRSYT